MFTNTVVNTGVLPAIAVRGLIPLPNNEIRLDVGRTESILALKEASKGDKYIVLLVQNNHAIEKPTSDDLNKLGLVAKLIYDMEGQSIHKVKLTGIVRCEVLEFIQTAPFMIVNVVTRPAVSDDLDRELACVRLLLDEIEKAGSKMFEGSPEATKAISQGVTADKLADILAYSLPGDFLAKLKYLLEPSIEERLKYLLDDIQREKYIRNLENDIEEQLRKNLNENQKEYYLREKMKVIQEELGDKAKKDADVEELRKKILDAKMPAKMEKKALDELARYSTLNSQGGESSISKTYLDFIVSLPWSKETRDCNDIKIAKDQLDLDHYGLEKVKDRILEYLAVRIMTKKTPQAILCFAGPPGVGKTSLARSIATALNKEFVKMSLGGVKDESEIRGHRRTYLGALPGRILQAMKTAGSINPVFLLDEIDKLSSDYRGDPASALLEVLDGEQNNTFSDHYLEEPYDLSKVFFITTANYLENIPAALKDRLEIVELSSYTEFEKLEIAKGHLVNKQLKLHGLSKCDFTITDGAILKIIQEYTKEAGVRQLERNIGTLIRRAIKSILLKEHTAVEIDETNLETWLGKPKFLYSKLEQDDQVGVVTGLAYTQFGGDTLPVEVTFYKGNGKLVLTGKLGDVMKESAMAALSYVRSNASKFSIDENLFKENDIHVHVPEGAIPKDGPSAGVTMATAIVSAMANRKVKHTVGMTGEITLRGRVLPIGGLREKAIAAHRSGLKTIVIPKENARDIDEIPETVQKELEIITATTIDDVLNVALV